MTGQPRLKKQDLIAGIAGMAIFMLIGTGLIVGAWIIYSGTRDFLEGATETTGVVVGFDRLSTGPQPTGETSPLVPIIKYTPDSGEALVVKAKTRSAWGKYEHGDRVKVFYDPRNPEEARVATGTELWFAPLLMLVIGLGALLIPPFTIWRYLRSQRVPNNGEA